MKHRIASVLPVLLATVAIALMVGVLTSACGDENASVAPTPTSTDDGSLWGPATAVVPPNPPARTSSIPDDWQTFTWRNTGFSFRFPAGWRSNSAIFSLPRWEGHRFPPTGLKIEPSLLPLAEYPRMDNVVEFSLGDLDGWQAMVEYDPALAGGVYRVHTIAFEYDGQRAMFTTYYGPEGYDPDTIWQVVYSLTLPS